MAVQEYLVSSSGQMSLPAGARHRWDLDHGGPVDVIDLGLGVLTVPRGAGRRLLDDLVSRQQHADFARSLDDDPDLATTQIERSSMTTSCETCSLTTSRLRFVPSSPTTSRRPRTTTCTGSAGAWCLPAVVRSPGHGARSTVGASAPGSSSFRRTSRWCRCRPLRSAWRRSPGHIEFPRSELRPLPPPRNLSPRCASGRVTTAPASVPPWARSKRSTGRSTADDHDDLQGFDGSTGGADARTSLMTSWQSSSTDEFPASVKSALVR